MYIKCIRQCAVKFLPSMASSEASLEEGLKDFDDLDSERAKGVTASAAFFERSGTY